MNTFQTLAVAALFSLGSSLAAACSPPNTPDLPDPKTAVTPQMIKAKNDVKAFLTDAEDFLKCNKSSRRHNDMVEAMHAVAEEFNGIVHAYKERMAG